MTTPLKPGPLAAGGAPAPAAPAPPALSAASTSTVATEKAPRRAASDTPTVTLAPRVPQDPFTLVTGESPQPVADTEEADLEVTRGSRRYEAGPVLGAGGMGEVRLHVDRRIGRRIARKTLHAATDTATARRRFLREVRVQGQLEHPAVVPVYDLDVDERGQVYFTMKRVRGETLERVLERLALGDSSQARFGTRRLLSAFAQVCLAVHYAHSRDVVHRDLKPANIMLGDFGEVYVLDWGLAKLVGEPDLEPGPEGAIQPADAVVGVSGALTVGGALLGTLAYMAPEQLLGKAAEVDARADVYALGAILFEILTLSRLRMQTDFQAVLLGLTVGEVERPSERAAGVPPELDALCVRALAIPVEGRLSSARELAEEVERYLDGDHDLRLRRELSATHAASARRRFEGEAGAPPAARGGAPAEGPESVIAVRPGVTRVEALRETMKALALDADNADAQRLLLQMLTDPAVEVPPEAVPALAAATDRTRARNVRTGMQGLLLWLSTLPLVTVIGVESWLAVGGLALATALAAAVAYRMSRFPRVDLRWSAVLATLVAAVVALTSCYLGPFTLVPTCAATASLLFATSATRRERRIFAAILAAGAMLPFLVEILGLVPRAYDFEPGRIIVFARAVRLPEAATMATMMYSTLTFTVFAMMLMGRMRDALSASERRQFLQAWYLRQLFPAAGGER
jgi:eukaryotic-like serine/threonine-protein kinase